MPEKPIRLSFTLFAVLVSTTLLQCRASEKNLQQDKTVLESLLKSKLGEKYTVTYNEPGTYGLCQQEREDDHLKRKLKFIVVRLSDHAVVNEGSFQMGYVRWRDKNSIEVVSSSTRRDDKAQRNVIMIDKNHR